MKFEKSLNQERVYIDMTFLCEEMVLNSPPPFLKIVLKRLYPFIRWHVRLTTVSLKALSDQNEGLIHEQMGYFQQMFFCNSDLQISRYRNIEALKTPISSTL